MIGLQGYRISVSVSAVVFLTGFLTTNILETSCEANEVFVEVLMNDGRRASGIIDQKTDADRLWLRSTAERIILRQSFGWSSLAGAVINGDSLTVAELKKISEGSESDIGPDFFSIPVTTDPLNAFQTGAAAHSTGWSGRIPETDSWQAVTFILEVEFGNWDRDVDADGYDVRLIPLNSQRRPVPIVASLTMTLIGDDYYLPRVFGEHNSRELERWSFHIRPTDFVGGGVDLRLPFRRLRPEGDPGIDAWGMLNAHLSVHGQVALNRSRPIRIRPYDHVRDRWQFDSGDRFYRPIEYTTSPRTMIRFSPEIYSGSYLLKRELFYDRNIRYLLGR